MDVYHTERCCHDHHGNILVVGEGNFSFAKELSLCEVTNSKIIFATSFDSKETVHKNDFAKSNVDVLQSQTHSKVYHSVDATELEKSFPNETFAMIVFNFPHVGGKSNIKKCRVLLKKFFASASKHVCNEGSILVALCKGQGGTPIDASRGCYGNTWQVVSQAAYSDLYLKRLETFNFQELDHYKQAGYRGQIGCGFLTRGGLVHAFKKGSGFKLTKHSEVNQRDNTNDAKQQFILDVEGCGSMYSSLHKTYACLEGILKKSMANFQDQYGFEFPTLLSEDLEPVLLMNGIIKNEVLHIPDMTFPADGLLQRRNSCQFNVNVVDSGSIINPNSTDQSQQFVRLTRFDNSSFHFSEIEKTMKDIFRNFNCEMCKCKCAIEKVMCSCFHGDQVMTPLLKVSTVDTRPLDITEEPHFLADVPSKLWTSFQPECTISFENETTKEVEYKRVSCSEYALNDCERKFFRDAENPTANYFQRRFFINGSCVATVRCERQKAETPTTISLAIIFHLDQILLSCYNVHDLRLLRTQDAMFIQHLLEEVVEDELHGQITCQERAYETVIKFPLCHRHDLCFWVDDRHTERQLMSSIRFITGDYIHTVRLIKALKYTETNLISYCYRFIYGRLDGSLHHEQCVLIQNELRKYLMHVGFSLR